MGSVTDLFLSDLDTLRRASRNKCTPFSHLPDRGEEQQISTLVVQTLKDYLF